MDHGKIAEQGTFEELMAKKTALFELMKNYSVDKKDDKVVEEAKVDEADDEVEGVGIIAAEDQEQGAVKGNVYWNYIQACGGYPYIILLVLAASLNSGTQLTSNLWLSWWSDDKYGLTINQYLFWYGILGIIQFFFALSLNTVFLTGGYAAAKTYHKAALARLMRAPMGFFDSQPIGRILNRMSKDIESIDQQIWVTLN
jgi:ATP-binding cassette, subfamily C (CFTR/MRP), member 1